MLLLPNTLGPAKEMRYLLPLGVEEAMRKVDGLIAESESGARSYLKHFQTKKKAHEMPVALLNKKTPFDHLSFLLEPIEKGEIWGLISDAGLPCLADPGSALVLHAHQKGIQVKVFAGPSSLFFALMLSGLPGQNFHFHGYIAREEERKKQLILWEKNSIRENSTQIFIEAPHKNQETLEECIQSLNDKTLFSIACDLSLPTEEVITLPIKYWRKKTLPALQKRPTVFSFNAHQ